MKKILIFEYGEEIVEKYRIFQVEVPDEMDETLLDADDARNPTYLSLLDELANNAGIDWLDDDESYGVYPLHCFIDVNDLDAEGAPVIPITHELMTLAKNERADVTT